MKIKFWNPVKYYRAVEMANGNKNDEVVLEQYKKLGGRWEVEIEEKVKPVIKIETKPVLTEQTIEVKSKRGRKPKNFK